VFIELEKALQTSAPQAFFRVLEDVDAHTVFWPEIEAPGVAALAAVASAVASPEWRFAALVSRLRPNEIDNIAGRVRLPTRYLKAANLVSSLYGTWPNESSLGNAEVVDLLYKADAIRQPARFAEANRLLSLLWSANNAEAPAIEATWSAYHDAVTDVTSDAIEGVEPGPELGAAIKNVRIERIAAIRRAIS
jgi:tRNA nucleotidyltransferase/poly(A) polymerase